jgi:hypothetical protein
MTETNNCNVREHQHQWPLFKQASSGRVSFGCDQCLLKSDHDSGCKHLPGALGGDPAHQTGQVSCGRWIKNANDLGEGNYSTVASEGGKCCLPHFSCYWFLSQHHNTSNHRHCNELTAKMGSSATTPLPAPAAAMMNPAAPVSIIKRVMKRGGKNLLQQSDITSNQNCSR